MKAEPGSIDGENCEDGADFASCARCGNALRLLVLRKGDARGTLRPLVNLCAMCLATGLEVATGYGFVNQLAHWDAFSAASSELGKDGARSKAAKRKTAEKLQRQAARKGQRF